MSRKAKIEGQKKYDQIIKRGRKVDSDVLFEDGKIGLSPSKKIVVFTLINSFKNDEKMLFISP